MERKRVHDGIGVGATVKDKLHFAKRILNNVYNLQAMAIRSLKEYLKEKRYKEERETIIKQNLCKRIMDKGLRKVGQGFRLLRVNKNDVIEKEIARVQKLRGVCKRLMYSSNKVMGEGYNTLKIYKNVCNLKQDALQDINALKDTL